MSAEESSPLEGTSRYDPERSMRTKLIIIGVALAFIIGAYAYVGTRDRSLDIETPYLISQQQEDGLICCTSWFEYDGQSYLLVVTRELEGEHRTVVFRVMTFEDDGSPREINAIGSPFPGLLPTRFSVVDQTAYVPLDGEQGAGIWAVDLSDPEWPEDAGFTETADGTTRQLGADGDLLAIHHTDEVVVLDISEPASPQIVSSFEQPESGVVAMKQNGGRLFINDAVNDEFRIFALDDPRAPEAYAVYVNPDGAGELAFEFGVQDAADRLDQTAPEGKYLDFAVNGDLVYLAASDRGLHVLDISDPDNPEIIGELATPDRAVRVVHDDARIHLLAASEGNVDQLTYSIHTFDVTDPVAPDLIRTINDVLSEPGIQALTVHDDRLFVGLYESLLVFDVGD